MTRPLACRLCKARPGTHFGWCPVVGGPGRRPAPAPVPAAVPALPPTPTARLGHLAAPASGTWPTGIPVVVATSAVLCPQCLGDWCDACNHTGMALPSDWTAAAPAPVPEFVPVPIPQEAAA